MPIPTIENGIREPAPDEAEAARPASPGERRRDGPARLRHRLGGWRRGGRDGVALGVAAAIAALAAASLLLAFAPVYDPWAWLVWGREVAGLELDTAAGPSWKPLPVVATTAFAAAGDAAPQLWLLLARAGWLAAAALAWRLAGRLARERAGVSARAATAAGALAAVGVILLEDPLIPWLRQFAGGLSEPLLVALALGAVDRGLDRRHGQTLALAAAAALLRPEAWPFAAAYAAWAWRERPPLRPWIALAAVAVPALWLVPDLVGSGSALTGAERARGDDPAAGAALDALGRGLLLAPLGLTLAAPVAVARAWARGDRAIAGLAAAALGWIVLVAAMAAAGFAGLARFSAPAGATICVLGAVGVAVLATGLRGALRRRRAGAELGTRARAQRALTAAGALVAAGVIAALAIDGGIRAAQLPGDAEGATRFADRLDGLTTLVDAAPGSRLTACGPLTTTDLFTQTALAWQLEQPISALGLRTATVPRRGVVIVAPGSRRAVLARAGRRGVLLAASHGWRAYELSCGTARSSPGGQRIAGVTGARR